MSERSEQFEQCKPALTDEEMSETAKAGRVVVSFTGRSAVGDTKQIDAIIIKFLLGDGSTATMIFDGYAFGKIRELSDAVSVVNSEMSQASSSQKH
jgi:hypothetical protein